MRPMIIAGLLVLLPWNVAVSATLERAELLREHDLIVDAKREYIDVVLGKGSSADKAEALYVLGTMAFEEREVTIALTTWRRLVAKYPKQAAAKRVKDRIKELAEIVGESARVSIDNALASSYLQRAEFWSKGKDRKYSIDTSWIPNVEAAIAWYDRVVTEFPGSVAARVALEEKLRAILGWEEPGRYGSKHGVRESYQTYAPMMESAFRELEKAFPDATSLQPFRYQVAQAHWRAKRWDKTRQWLNEIVAQAGDARTFYRDLAERRLKKVEY